MDMMTKTFKLEGSKTITMTQGTWAGSYFVKVDGEIIFESKNWRATWTHANEVQLMITSLGYEIA